MCLSCLCHYPMLSKRDRGKVHLSVYLSIHTFLKTMAHFQKLLQYLKTSVDRPLNSKIASHPHQSKLKFYQLQFMQSMPFFPLTQFLQMKQNFIQFYFSNKAFPGLAIALILNGRSLKAVTLCSLTLFAPSYKVCHPFHTVSIEAVSHFCNCNAYKMGKKRGSDLSDLR